MSILIDIALALVFVLAVLCFAVSIYIVVIREILLSIGNWRSGE